MSKVSNQDIPELPNIELSLEEQMATLPLESDAQKLVWCKVQFIPPENQVDVMFQREVLLQLPSPNEDIEKVKQKVFNKTKMVGDNVQGIQILSVQQISKELVEKYSEESTGLLYL